LTGGVTSSRPASVTIRRTRIRRGRVAALLVVIALATVLCDQLLTSSSSTATSPVRVPDGARPGPRSEHRVPGTGDLDPALAGALRRAAADAADEGVELVVESGRRSPEHQQRLLDDAVAKYGSEAEAARWVATPERSAHVSGDAVDIGPDDATAWLSRHGAEYGLCQIYVNEPWHYELRPEATDRGCPLMYADPTRDPRMHG
jgi:zinc D-Ala-D-Ala carboxypeptidase